MFSTDFRLPNDCDTKYPPSRSKSFAAPVGVPGNLESSLYSTVRRMNPCRRNKKWYRVGVFIVRDALSVVSDERVKRHIS